MSSVVVRAAYRKILKLANELEKQYDGDTAKACFAVFGLALQHQWFVHSHWGTTSQQIIRSWFSRRSMSMDPSDAMAARLAESFDAIKRLREAVGSDRAGGGTEPHADRGASDDTHQPRVALATANVVYDKRTHGKLDVQFIKIAVADYTTAIPPYRYLLPPEPFYYQNTSIASKAPFVATALYTMTGLGALSTASAPATLKEALVSVPATSVTVTGHVEVEVRTEYLGNNDWRREEDDDDGSLSAADAGEAEEVGELHRLSVAAPGSSKAKRPLAPANNSHYFRYVVFIRNLAKRQNAESWTVTLLSRHWVFLDVEHQSMVEVVGPGVVGNFPEMQPGESHVYESGTVMEGRYGVMYGTFQMLAVSKDGKRRSFDVAVGPTRLQ